MGGVLCLALWGDSSVLVEHHAENVGVTGSTPVLPTTFVVVRYVKRGYGVFCPRGTQAKTVA
jgi:hypothetical protein